MRHRYRMRTIVCLTLLFISFAQIDQTQWPAQPVEGKDRSNSAATVAFAGNDSMAPENRSQEPATAGRDPAPALTEVENALLLLLGILLILTIKAINRRQQKRRVPKGRSGKLGLNLAQSSEAWSATAPHSFSEQSFMSRGDASEQ